MHSGLQIMHENLNKPNKKIIYAKKTQSLAKHKFLC